MPVVVISSEVVFGAPQINRPDAIPAVTIIEFDAPRCLNVYGIAPCTAAVGVTGSRKCFNTRATCQDLPNFNSELVTFRFCKPSAQIFRDDGGDVVPSVKVVRTTPQLLNPGRDLGQRESIVVSFDDHPHTDAGLDPYLSERTYNPFTQGTFWGKFRARYASLRGMPLRIYRGFLGDELDDMETWHYVIESATLTGTTFTINAKDHLKVLDGDRAQAPNVSRGQLSAPLAAGGGSFTLEPTGIGDEDYPASGRGALGGKEIVDYTRVGDVVTLTARGQSNTEDQDHDEGDRFQVVLVYTAQTVQAIINDLLTNYTEADPAWIPFSDWDAEVSPIVDQLYSAEIAEPTDVRKLINELIEQVGLIMWWDAQAMLFRLSALRPVVSAATVDENTIVAGSFSSTEQPAKRISEVWTYFNLRNPLERIDTPENFSSIAVAVDESADPLEPPAIYKVFSRWIGFGNRAAAVRVNGLLRSRYSEPPRRFKYRLFRDSPMPTLGRGSVMSHYSLQDDTGARTTRPCQVVSVAPDYDVTAFEVEEMIFTANDDLSDTHLVVIDVDTNDINLRTIHDTFYSAPSGGETILCIVETGVTIGASASTTPAFDVGSWPGGVTITLLLRGTIRGAGGKGGDGGTMFSGGADGEQGGTALLTTVPIELDSSGEIAGGGGGGAGGDSFVGFVGPGGGGGAGRVPGQPGLGPFGLSGAGPNQPTAGTETTGGTGGSDSARTAGNGGAPGTAGDSAPPDGGTGGAAGFAIDGDSLVTYTNPGTITGPVTN